MNNPEKLVPKWQWKKKNILAKGSD